MAATPLTNTVSDLITLSYQAIGVVGEGATPSTAQQTSALSLYNTMVKSWAGYGIDTWARDTNTFSLTADTASYTIGPSGDVNAARPLRMLNMYRSDSDTDTPLFEYSKQEYFWLSDKDQSGIPTQFYYDQKSPLGTLFLWPVPDSNDLPLTLTYDAHVPIAKAALTDEPGLTDEWQDAIIHNLALKLAMRNGRPITADLRMAAQMSLELAKGLDYEEASIYPQPDNQFGR